MAANLSGILLRLTSVVVHPDASKNNEQGPSIVCVIEPLHIVFEIFIFRQAAWDSSPVSFLNPLHECCYLSGHISGAQLKRKRQYQALQRAVRHSKTQSLM
jgi:hypothetical protein